MGLVNLEISTLTGKITIIVIDEEEPTIRNNTRLQIHLLIRDGSFDPDHWKWVE